MPATASAGASSGATNQAAGKRKRRLHVPTSLVVTLIGIALSAWLIPAFTRQWDDRQKEQELKTSLVAEMASATARAVVGGEGAWAPGPRATALRVRLGRAWAIASLKIEARLRAYFSDDVVAGWEIYSWLVERFVGGDYVSQKAALESATEVLRLDEAVSGWAAVLFVTADYGNRERPPWLGPADAADAQLIDELESTLLKLQVRRERSFLNSGTLRPRFTAQAIELNLLGLEHAVADQILRSHARGYSTSGHALVRDLIP